MGMPRVTPTPENTISTEMRCKTHQLRAKVFVQLATMLRSAFVGIVKSSLGLPLVGMPAHQVRWYTEGPKLPLCRSGDPSVALQASLPPSAGAILRHGPAARFMSSRASPIFGSSSSMVRVRTS